MFSQRWLHSLSPEIKKTAWTAEEDSALLSLYDTHGPKWSVIARKIPGRTDDACSKRYREALDPSLKKDEWTHEEDCHLREVYGRLGGKWGDIGRELNRSGLACRNRCVVHAFCPAFANSAVCYADGGCLRERRQQQPARCSLQARSRNLRRSRSL